MSDFLMLLKLFEIAIVLHQVSITIDVVFLIIFVDLDFSY